MVEPVLDDAGASIGRSMDAAEHQFLEGAVGHGRIAFEMLHTTMAWDASRQATTS